MNFASITSDTRSNTMKAIIRPKGSNKSPINFTIAPTVHTLGIHDKEVFSKLRFIQRN